MESLTYIKNVDLSAKKMRFMLDAIKKMKPAQALVHLYYTAKKPARIYYSAIKSAISNAKQALKTSEDLLEFKTFLIEEGKKIKRFRAGSKGIAKPIVRRFSHIKIILVAKQPVIVKQPEVKKEIKKEEAKPKEELKPKKTTPRRKTSKVAVKAKKT